MKDYDKNKDSSYLKYQDVNDQYGWAISQKLLFNAFKSVEETSQFNEDFMRRYWWQIYFWIWCSISSKVAWSTFTNFTTKNKNWESWKTFSQLAWRKNKVFTWEI